MERQCEEEFNAPLAEQIAAHDVVLSMACGVGVQTLAEQFPDAVIYPRSTPRSWAGPRSGASGRSAALGCGNCVLDKFGGVCPIARCSKNLLNGPCGGSARRQVRSGSQELDCAWQLIYDRLTRSGQLDRLTEVEPPKDWSHLAPRRPAQDRPGGHGAMKSGSRLERILTSGGFRGDGRAGPAQGHRPGGGRRKAGFLRGVCDAVNVTDNQTAIVRLSSVATVRLLVHKGLEPVMQMTCRDRNRLAIQADLFGAVALGVRNLLCLTGDHQRFGNHPTAKNVYDLDSIQLIQMVARMRDQGLTAGGDPIEGKVPLFIGGAANPFGDPFEMRVIRLAKKVAAGADFIQTQCIFDLPRFRELMKRVVDRGLHEKVHILAGVMPLKSAGAARYINDNVAGI